MATCFYLLATYGPYPARGYRRAAVHVITPGSLGYGYPPITGPAVIVGVGVIGTKSASENEVKPERAGLRLLMERVTWPQYDFDNPGPGNAAEGVRVRKIRSCAAMDRGPPASAEHRDFPGYRAERRLGVRRADQLDSDGQARGVSSAWHGDGGQSSHGSKRGEPAVRG